MDQDEIKELFFFDIKADLLKYLERLTMRQIIDKLSSQKDQDDTDRD